jgi:Transglycosylase SLT domain
MMDLPPDMQERVVCSITAAIKYEIPANILLTIAEKEGGKSGQWISNRNGTHDVGAMQFNTAYLQDLSRYGISADDVAKPGCYAYDLAAWRVRLHIKNDKGDIWTKAANYHSRTPKYNTIYRADLIARAVKWADRLEERFIACKYG